MSAARTPAFASALAAVPLALAIATQDAPRALDLGPYPQALREWPPAPPVGVPSSVAVDAEGRPWAAGDHGVARLLADGRWERLDPSAGTLGAERCGGLSVTPDGEVWVGTQAGFSRYRGGRWEGFGVFEGLCPGRGEVVVARQGRLWAATSEGLAVREAHVWRRVWASEFVRTVLVDTDGLVWAGSEDGLVADVEGTPSHVLEGVVTGGVVDAGGTLWVAVDGTLRRRSRPGADFVAVEGLADPSVRCLGTGPDGRLWVGGARGLTLLEPGGASRRHFASRRWLPGDEVSAVWPEADGCWVATAGGLARIRFVMQRLEDKAAAVLRVLQERHRRGGLVSRARLDPPEDLGSARAVPGETDLERTAWFASAEALRHAVTLDPEALGNAREAVGALLALEAVAGTTGLVARTRARAEEAERDGSGNWRAGVGEGWLWRGEAGREDLAGLLLSFTLYVRRPSGDGEQPAPGAVAAAASRAAEPLLTSPERTVDGFRALTDLCLLRVAFGLTGEGRYLEALGRRLTEGDHAMRVRGLYPEGAPPRDHAAEAAAFLALAALLPYEPDGALAALARDGLSAAWPVLREDRNPLCNVVYAALTRLDADRAQAARALERFPQDLRDHAVDNAWRADLTRRPVPDPLAGPLADPVLPPDERPLGTWSSNPRRLAGGDGGRTEEDGAWFLLAYWLARAHGVLAEGE
ncbi:MAG: hypothetical protein HY722_00045 [Planctomycetes bacterium]|nr:hypothetical protein [Planctomycetota bacterium]